MNHDFTPSSSIKARQQFTLLQALKAGPVSTIAARESLGISHPAGRAMELRKQGHPISTLSSQTLDAQGRPHRCALYVLGVAA